jgi:hypothetical protein
VHGGDRLRLEDLSVDLGTVRGVHGEAIDEEFFDQAAPPRRIRAHYEDDLLLCHAVEVAGAGERRDG